MLLTKLIDLSHELHDGIPVYPGDEEFRLVQTKSAKRDGYTSFVLNTALHAGTHLDAPLHFLTEGSMICDLPLETFLGRGCLVDARGEMIVRLRPEHKSMIREGDIVLLWTEHSAKYGTDAYYQEHPVLHGEWADFLISMGIKLVGVDLPAPDNPPFPIHKKLLGAGIPIIENLTKLGDLAGLRGFEVMAFPLRIRAEGSPVRVVARAT